MAYNPFNIFRRNQKALFAVLTVFVMVVFTLSSGVAGGDFFETFSRWLGAKSGSKEALCKIDGHTVTVGELEGSPRSLQFKRVLANRFMALAADQTVRNLEGYISEQFPRLGEEGKATAQGAFQLLAQVRMRGISPVEARQLPLIANAMTARIESPTAKSEDKEVARAAQVMFLLLSRLAEGGNSQYFTNAPNKTLRDLIEFRLWEKKADQLGIKFTKDDVKKLLQNEFSGFFRSDVEVRKAMQQTQGFTMEACLEALAAEFRVRTAQTAVLGTGSRFNRVTVYPTPYEIFEYYRDQCSPATYDVIPVPASAFVDKVVGEPSEAEINDLFKKYADSEPNPKSETPGFKAPRKISVAYLGITGEEPYYKKLAEEQVKVGEVMARMSGVFTAPLPGGMETWVMTALAPLSLKEPAVDAAYASYVQMFNDLHKTRNYQKSTFPPLRSPFSTFEPDDQLLPTSVVRPGVVAATLGSFVGQSAGFGNAASAAALSMMAPLAYEMRDRITTGLPLVLGGIPNPALMQTALGGVVQYRAKEPKPLSIETLRPVLIKSAIEKRAKVLAFGDPSSPASLEKGDVARFIEELEKLSDKGKPKDKAAVEKYIKDFITTRGLTHVGASSAPQDEWHLEDDPALAPLVNAQKDSLKSAGGFHGDEYIPFGQSFFWTSEFDRNSFQRRRGPATSGIYLAERFPPQSREESNGKPHYVVWRTEDIPPQKRNRDTARQEVIDAWKRLKARELAQQRANQLADAIRANPAANEFAISQFVADQSRQLEREITNPKARERAKRFVLGGIAPLVPATSLMARIQGGQMERFSLQPTEKLPYPTLEMETALLENRDKPLKTVLVLADAPKDTFYVATLSGREMKEADEFRREVYSSAGRARVVRGQYQEEAMNKARASAVELLKKEFNYEETEEQKKKLDENAKSGGKNAD